METSIEKYSSKELYPLDERLAMARTDHPNDWVTPLFAGNYILDTRYSHYCYRIVEVTTDYDKQWNRETQEWDNLDTLHIVVKAIKFDPFELHDCDDGYKKPVELNPQDHGKDYQVFKDLDELKEYFSAGMDVITEKSNDFLKPYDIEESGLDDNSTALVSMSSKQTYVNAKNEAVALATEMNKRLAVVKICIEEQKSKYDIIRRNCESAIAVVRRKITRIERVLGQIELYIGVNEDVVQIQEGAPAPIKRR